MRLLTSARSSAVPLPPERVWAVVAGAGPGPHWYADAAAFRFRSALDRILLGPAPRPVPDRALLRAGDRAGFWEVVAADRHELDLVARVRAPGEVRFTASVAEDPAGARLTQRVSFRPAGLLGTAYLIADLPAREVLIATVHRRTVEDLRVGGRAR